MPGKRSTSRAASPVLSLQLQGCKAVVTKSVKSKLVGPSVDLSLLPRRVSRATSTQIRLVYSRPHCHASQDTVSYSWARVPQHKLLLFSFLLVSPHGPKSDPFTSCSGSQVGLSKSVPLVQAPQKGNTLPLYHPHSVGGLEATNPA